MGAAVAALIVGLATISFIAPAEASAKYGMWSDSLSPRVKNVKANRTTVGVQFVAKADGKVSALQLYATKKNRGKHIGRLWTSDGKQLAKVTFSKSPRSGWKTAKLSRSVSLKAGKRYIVSYTAPKGGYVAAKKSTTKARGASNKYLTAVRGVSARGTAFPTKKSKTVYFADVVFKPSKKTASKPVATKPAPVAKPAPAPKPVAPAPAPESTTPAKPAERGDAPTRGDAKRWPGSRAPKPSTEPKAPAPSTSDNSTESSKDSGSSGSTGESSTPSTGGSTPSTGGSTGSTGSSTGSTGWPNASNTGPSGSLSSYTGPCTITTPGYEIKNANALGRCDAILIRAKDVKITNSIVPRVDATDWSGPSVTVTDSEVRAGSWVDGAVWGYNFTVIRSEVTGGQHSVHCASNCTVIDSWLHSQYNPSGKDFHTNAFITNGGRNMVVRGNTLHCDSILNSTGGGCSGNLSLFGDFEPVSNVTVENNLFKANNSSISYCLYGGYQPSKKYPIATGIKVHNNVFERGSNGKCGVYGPVTSFQTGASGNAWSGNTWVGGGAVNPSL